MMTYLHRVMGCERIKQICDEFRLNAEDQATIDKILIRWEGLIGNPVAKLEAAQSLLTDSSNAGAIIRAINKICIEFAQKRMG